MDLTALAARLHMRYYEEYQLLFGKVGGYECAVREQPEKRMMMVHLVAKPQKADDSGMEQLLEQLLAQYPAVSAAVYENFTASLRLDTKAAEDPQQLAQTLLEAISGFARHNGYLPCCCGCGKTRDVRRFLLDGDAKMLCPVCRAKAETELTDQWQRKKFQHHSVWKGAIAVLLILMIGATAWIWLYIQGLSAMLAGAAMTVLSFLAYQYLAGRMKKGSIILLLLAIVATVLLCHNLCVAFELVVAIGQQQQITITGALLFIPTFLKDPVNREVYFLQLGLSLLAVAFAAAPMLWMVYYSWHHRQRPESLEEPAA